MPRVVNQTHTLIAVRQLVYLFARTVVAHTIRDDDLESEGGIILSQHGLQTWNDRSRFVAHRHDDAYEVVCDGPDARGRRGRTHGSRTATHICVELSSSREKPAKSWRIFRCSNWYSTLSLTPTSQYVTLRPDSSMRLLSLETC